MKTSLYYSLWSLKFIRGINYTRLVIPNIDIQIQMSTVKWNKRLRGKSMDQRQINNLKELSACCARFRFFWS